MCETPVTYDSCSTNEPRQPGRVWRIKTIPMVASVISTVMTRKPKKEAQPTRRRTTLRIVVQHVADAVPDGFSKHAVRRYGSGTGDNDVRKKNHRETQGHQTHGTDALEGNHDRSRLPVDFVEKVASLVYFPQVLASPNSFAEQV